MTLRECIICHEEKPTSGGWCTACLKAHEPPGFREPYSCDDCVHISRRRGNLECSEYNNYPLSAVMDFYTGGAVCNDFLLDK